MTVELAVYVAPLLMDIVPVGAVVSIIMFLLEAKLVAGVREVATSPNWLGNDPVMELTERSLLSSPARTLYEQVAMVELVTEIEQCPPELK